MLQLITLGPLLLFFALVFGAASWLRVRGGLSEGEFTRLCLILMVLLVAMVVLLVGPDGQQ